jgi:hypothetical protein
MKSPTANTEAGICLPGEQSWELWKHSSAGWQVAQTVPAELGAAAFKTAGVFGYPVSAAFAVPVRAATGDADLLPDIVDFQLEKQGLKPETPVGRLMDYRTVERSEHNTLVLASVLNAKAADTLPKEAPQRFEISPYLYYLPDDHLVIWRELGRLVFCITRGDQPVYYHALTSDTLRPDTAQELEQLLMPLFTQGIVEEIKGIMLWTEAVEPGAVEELQRTFGARVRSERRPAPAVPQEVSTIEPVSVAMAKIRSARMARIRNYILLGMLLYLAVPAFLAVRYYMAQTELETLRGQVGTLNAQFGSVEKALVKKQVIEGVTNADRYPIEVLNQVLAPLYQPNSGVRITNLEVERKMEDSGLETMNVSIKGESGSGDGPALRYTTRIKGTLALNFLDWAFKVEQARNGAVPFTLNGSPKKEDAEDAPK